ncbi:hypothetical protein [Nocardioides taihuensis]|uniref:Secreted protein n=1 Tax=Nocardioides taihuensis TaxID=1835606 RepID=A0ABW0BDN2_9ACTN
MALRVLAVATVFKCRAAASLGYRLHTISTAASGSKGPGGGDRIQATMVFERITWSHPSPLV